ncbi:hypothetical protein SAMD00023353_5100430 [Rosellinia necatrix]|uniref:Uncharacterized protein n=1 Tax=Rosellinia necatrix TaxID=77044 RepID=A0A1S8A9T1_ROSNE|nr:hypothetical protein SAMD00023353_5100430 [Rosellinia necatrix]
MPPTSERGEAHPGRDDNGANQLIGPDCRGFLHPRRHNLGIGEDLFLDLLPWPSGSARDHYPGTTGARELALEGFKSSTVIGVLDKVSYLCNTKA